MIWEPVNEQYFQIYTKVEFSQRNHTQPNRYTVIPKIDSGKIYIQQFNLLKNVITLLSIDLLCSSLCMEMIRSFGYVIRVHLIMRTSLS